MTMQEIERRLFLVEVGLIDAERTELERLYVELSRVGSSTLIHSWALN